MMYIRVPVLGVSNALCTCYLRLLQLTWNISSCVMHG